MGRSNGEDSRYILNPGSGWGRLLTAAGFVGVYVLLGASSFVPALAPLGIASWNPGLGLSLAFLLVFGSWLAPLQWLAALLVDLVLHPVAGGPLRVMMADLVAAAAILMAALALRRVDFDPSMTRLRDVVLLMVVGFAGALAGAVSRVEILAPGVGLSAAQVSETIVRSWCADTLGILTITPLGLIAASSGLRPFRRLWQPEVAVQILLLAFTVWLMLGVEAHARLRFLYLLVLPLLWIALRRGLLGAAVGLGLVTFALVLGTRLTGWGGESPTPLLVLMVAMGMTSLLVGGLADERVQARRLLQDSEARLNALVRVAPDGVLTIGADGVVESVNPACERLFGAPAELLVGRRLNALLPELPADAVDFPGGETLASRLDGTRVPVEVALSDARLSDRRLAIGIVRDITRRKESEARLWAHRSRLSDLSRQSVSENLASAIAHQLNQPLTAMIGYCRAAQRLVAGGAAPARAPGSAAVSKPSTAQVDDAMNKAVVQAERAGEIIRRLREFLRTGEVAPEAIPPQEMLEGVAQLVAGEIAAQQVDLAVEVAPGLTPLWAERIQIEQVLLNLVRNSIDSLTSEPSSAAQPRRIVLAARPAAAAGMVEIEVRDNGPGIAPDIAGDLFTPFATTKTGGMGLGLLIARSIVEAHGGALWVAAAAHGASLRFTLPAPREPISRPA